MTLPLLLAVLLTAQAEAPAPPAMAGDAQLNDVCFVDAEHGWAVGDRGVIWCTADGGRHWQWQNSGVACRLATVCFRDSQVGWAAGGFTHPYLQSSSGVVLATRDGGQTWTSRPNLTLPAVQRLRFFDDRRGWAVGCASALFPSGVYMSDDAGRTWRPLPGHSGDGWLGGDLLNAQTGVLAGRNGAAAAVCGGEVTAPQTTGPALNRLLQVRMLDARHAWLSGDAGCVLNTSDGGHTWQAPMGALPAAAAFFDFTAMAVQGSQCWLAGAPGTRVFVTRDLGRTWSSQPTGVTTPLRALAFVDDAHGWAVGDLGAILATQDGGRTWQRQHGEGTRAAVLGLFGEVDDVPLELFARLGGEEGYLTAVDVVGRRDIEVRPRGDAPPAARLHEALVRLGGVSADVARQFPLRQAGLQFDAAQIVRTWDRVHNEQGKQALETHLLRQICMWRPDVVFTRGAGLTGEEPLATVVSQAVVDAIAKAGQAENLPPQFAAAGLTPWTVQRAFAALPAGGRGSIELLTGELATNLGGSLADVAAEPRGLFQTAPAAAPLTLPFRVLNVGTAQDPGRRDFLAGISVPHDGAARRAGPMRASDDFNTVKRTLQKRRYIQAILEQSLRMQQSAEQLLARTNELTRELDDVSAGRMFYQLAERYAQTGRWQLAAETFQTLLERFPRHPLAPQALFWLIRFHASREIAWRMQRDPAQQAARYSRALTLAKDLERNRPEWFAEPLLSFPLAAACRNLAQPAQAQRYYQLQGQVGEGSPWQVCARCELHLTEAKTHLLKPVLTCARTAQRPHLDGKFEEAFWQQAKHAALQSQQHDDDAWPAEVMAAYDGEFLYLAGRCRRAGATAAPKSDTTRPRDADLSKHDRIEIFLDLDRDYATYFRLAVDDRGWTNDSLWDDASWDPAWYVAAKQDGDVWMFEAALPFAQITDQPPAPGDIWALGMQRVVPGAGFQAWSEPAAVAVLPEGFGYLRFE